MNERFDLLLLSEVGLKAERRQPRAVNALARLDNHAALRAIDDVAKSDGHRNRVESILVRDALRRR